MLTGRSTNPDDYQSLPPRVAVMAKNFASGHLIAPHAHERDQLLYAVSGVMAVHTNTEAWIVPPDRAVYIPGKVRHSVSIRGDVEMRTLYIRRSRRDALPRQPTVLEVGELLRSLILALINEPVAYDPRGRAGLLARLLLIEVAGARRLPLSFPMPQDARLKRICDALLADPSADWTLERWSEEVGASARQLARLFERDLRMSFALWRRRIRFHHAVDALAAGRPIAEVARNNGYRSASAFAAAFRKSMGMAPSQIHRHEN